MNRIFYTLAFLVLFQLNSFPQFSSMSNYSNKGWVTSSCVEADTIWAGTTGGLVKWLKDGTLLQTYSSTDGLMHNSVTSLAIDKDGNKWMGSKHGGLTMFDGKNWTDYDEMYRTDHEVYTLVFDAYNKLWCGTWAGGVYCFDGENWINYRVSNSGLVNDYVHSIAIDADGSLWFGTQNGVSHFDGNTWVSYTASNSEFAVRASVFSIAIDKNNNKWFGFYGGIAKFDGTNWTNYLGDKYPDLDETGIMSLAVEDDALWLGTEHNRIIKFENNITTVISDGNSKLLPGRVQHINITENGEKYFSTGDLITEGGVSRYLDGNWKEYSTVSPFSHNYIMSLCEDNQKNIWVGDFGGGVSMYDGENWIKHTSLGRVNAIKTDKANNIWFATNSGLWKYNWNEWIQFTTEDGIPGSSVRDIAFDDDGNLWLACEYYGAGKFDGENWIKYTTSNSGICDDDLNIVTVDADNNVCFGSNNKGISVFDGETFTNYDQSNSTLTNTYIHAIEIDVLGNMWVADHGDGVSKFDGNKWVKFDTSNSDIYQNGLYSIECDKNGLMWFGHTAGGGVSVYNGENWRHYDNHNSDLINDYVYTIYCDSENNLLFGTCGGFSKGAFTWYEPELSLSVSSLTVSALASSTATFDITSNTDWTAASDKTWLKLSESSGSGNVTQVLTVSENSAFDIREATITVSGTDVEARTIHVIQTEASYLTLSSTSLTVSAPVNSTNTFDVNSNIYWTVVSDKTWLTVSDDSGSGDATLVLTAAENSTYNIREATITVSGTGVEAQTVHVTQSDIVTGIADFENENFTIYPNPVSDILYLNAITDNVIVTIADLSGRILLNKKIINNKIDIRNLQKGVYMIRVNNNNRIMTRKFMKK
ncbi:T9SS C-terminal target domain-containing protein [Ancylomarina euxinus]|uniref:T9SS C-terminal target domain-containing protein n=1 Tax=Ancylomarina euxinus TaxID=2283627 RepID=A0A425XWI3_9BACT|nr:two-component regulator propeller domain-containing protein [Ancylomarina euxinus]MCZ4696427.1 BACON domain-containing carbohydrate-binding protein [Ancylomarina euxinus]MUP16802.1 T9SS type A sorting domain-containing protein [Ancylomarina euxinus]RRG19000.1 T9SS C-terminal target domain-containing protein [Ancylomarina euxinus]